MTRPPMKRVEEVLLVVAAMIAVVAGALRLTGRPIPFVDARPATDEDIEAQYARDIKGTDRDANGIRDDVEAWIDQQSAAGRPERNALLQVAANYQGVLQTTGNLQQSLAQLLRLSESMRCVRYVFQADADSQIVQLKAVVLDRDIRVRAWLKAYERFEQAGLGVDSTPSASACRFPLP